MGVEHTVGWTGTVGADGGGGKSCPESCLFLGWKHHSVYNEMQIASFAT